MTQKQTHLLKRIHQQFTDYYNDFLSIADRAPELFMRGELDARLQDDLLRVQLYRIAIDKSVSFVEDELKSGLYDYDSWVSIRAQFMQHYENELATTYFTSVMRKVFAKKAETIEFEDDGVVHKYKDPINIVGHYSIDKAERLAKAILAVFDDSVFAGAYSKTLSEDAEVMVDIIHDHVSSENDLITLNVLNPPFFRGKGAYLIGHLRGTSEHLPLVFCCVRSEDGIKIDGVLVGHEETRSFLFSSTRSAFTVSTRFYQEICSFLQQMYPGENEAYILDIIGFSHPAKVCLLQQLRTSLQSGENFRYLGTGPIDFVFGVDDFPLVFKVIRGGLENRQEIIHNFIKVHTIDRLGQVLDSLDYHNVQFARHHFSENLISRLEQNHPEDVEITPTHVFLKRVYLARRIIPVIEQVRIKAKNETRQILLNVGWNIKHLAAMGLFPQSLGLRHFGITSWGRIVYLDNASLADIRLFTFGDRQNTNAGLDQHRVDPAEFELELNIPSPHREIFRAIHGDLYTTRFWEEIKSQVINGIYPDYYPYPSSSRLEQRRFRNSVLEELQRVSDSIEADQIHMALGNLAVADVELAGLSFLRLEVPTPSARVLVIEPIGPEIIAQLYRRFRDVTFDILQSESEVVESAGQWTPGIHGKLNALVQIRRYDYVIGYVNETFDEDFFRQARLKGFLLLSTGTHNIDVGAATKFYTVVTNAPGPTTTTVAEQNIGLILDALFSRSVRYGLPADGFCNVGQDPSFRVSSFPLAQAMWFCFLQKTLRLEEMFSFGASELYVRTGVGERATVYHDQIGRIKRLEFIGVSV